MTVSGFRTYFVRSSSIAGGQLPCCSWTRAHSFSRSLPGCARCLSGCRAYSSGQMETAKAKAQATSGPEGAASPASPDSSCCASRAHTPPDPRPCHFSASQVLAWPTVPSGFSVILSPTAWWWDLPASGMSLPLHFTSARSVYHLQCCVLYYRLCLPSLVEYQLHTGGRRACFFP